MSKLKTHSINTSLKHRKQEHVNLVSTNVNVDRIIAGSNTITPWKEIEWKMMKFKCVEKGGHLLMSNK